MPEIIKLEQHQFFSKKDFIESYNIGVNSNLLKIRSAEEKGRKNNRRRPILEALNFPYIQPNSNYNLSWFVFDIDRFFDFNEIFDKNLPLPNFIVFTKGNNHAQVWYRLDRPIWIQKGFENSLSARFQKIVYNALRDAFDADKHFNRCMCKNPFFYSGNEKNAKWQRIDFTNKKYSLSDLACHLDLVLEDSLIVKPLAAVDDFERFTDSQKSKNEKIKTFPGYKEGARNEELFNFARVEIYKYYSSSGCSESALMAYSEDLINELNKENNPPLELKECENIARSISKWTVKNIHTGVKCQKRYTKHDREKSLYKRRKAAEKKLIAIQKLLKKEPDLSNREIARLTGYSLGSVNDYVSQIKKNSYYKKSPEIKKNFDSVIEHFVNQFVFCDLNDRSTKDGHFT